MDGVGSVERRCKCQNDTPKQHCACRRSDVRWRAIPRVDGRKVQTATFATAGEAKAHIAQVEGGGYGARSPRPGRAVLFRDWVEEWKATRAVLKPSTRAADRSRLPHLLNEFGELLLDQIGPTVVRQWVAQVSQSMAPKSVRHCHAMLHGVLQMAVAEGLLGRNPCEGTTLPESTPREHIFLTKDEARALIAAHPLLWRPLPMLLVGTGMRWAEAVGLRVRRVDIERGKITVAETWSPRYGWGTPKSAASRRRVVVIPDVLTAIEPLLIGKGPDDPVFLTPRGRMVHHANYRERVWLPAVEAAGLAGRGLTPHGLRHTYVAWLIANGVPLTAIQRQLGHKSIQVTSDVYGGLMPEVDERMVVASIEVWLAGVPDTVPDGL
jgi:integrase